MPRPAPRVATAMRCLSFAGRPALLAIGALVLTACCPKPGTGMRKEWQGPFQSMAAQDTGTCAARAVGPTLCWGDARRAKLTFPAGPFTKISGTDFQICGLKPAGTIVCTGYPDPVGTFIDLAIEGSELCTVDPGHQLRCRHDGSPYPRAELRHAGATKVAFDDSHDVCSLDLDGSVGCWRRRNSDHTVTPDKPRSIVVPGRFVDFSVFHGHGCALRPDGTAACWGDPALIPPAGTSFTQLSVGGDRPWGGTACGLVAGGSIVCFGNPMGGLALAVPPTGSFRHVSLGKSHACALRTSGDVSCWGHGGNGQVTGSWWH